MKSVAAAVVLAGSVVVMVSGAVAEDMHPPPGSVPAADMVVTATRTVTRQTDIPASVEVIGADLIAQHGASAAEPLFRTMTGADVQGGGVPGARRKINMRGLSPGLEGKRVLVLMDGRRLGDAYQGNVDLSTLFLDGVRRVEVLRGPASALYGSGAMGGVISMESRRGTETPLTEIGAAAGDHGTQRYGLRHGGQQGGLDYFFSGNHIRTDGYLRNADGSRQDWASYHLDGNAGYRLGERSELRLFLGAYDGEGRDDTSDREVRKDYQMLTFRTDWHESREADLLLRAYRNGDKHVYNWFERPAGAYRQETLGAEVQQSLWISTRQRLTTGAEMRRDAVDITEPGNPVDKSSTGTAVYLQNEIHLTDRWQVTLGLRRDQSEDYAEAWSPRIGLLFKVSEVAEVYGSFNRAHRAPSLSDRFVRVEFRGMQFIGNPDLDPETLTAYEVGGRLRLGERLHIRSAVFYSDLDDTFEFMFSPADGAFRNANVARAEIYGVELAADGRLTDRLSAFMNYTWTDGTTREHPGQPDIEGNRLAYLVQDKINIGVQYAGPKAGTHRVAAGYTGSRYGDAQNTLQNRMDAYTTLNWSSRLALRDNLWLTLAIDNLTDEDYREYPTHAQPGRTVMAGVDARF